MCTSPQPGSLNWFGSILQPLFVFPATIPNMFYHRFQVHALLLVDPSHSCELLTHPIDQPKRKLLSGLHIRPGCCFFCIKTHHIAVLLPKSVISSPYPYVSHNPLTQPVNHKKKLTILWSFNSPKLTFSVKTIWQRSLPTKIGQFGWFASSITYQNLFLTYLLPHIT